MSTKTPPMRIPWSLFWKPFFTALMTRTGSRMTMTIAYTVITAGRIQYRHFRQKPRRASRHIFVWFGKTLNASAHYLWGYITTDGLTSDKERLGTTHSTSLPKRCAALGQRTGHYVTLFCSEETESMTNAGNSNNIVGLYLSTTSLFLLTKPKQRYEKPRRRRTGQNEKSTMTKHVCLVCPADPGEGFELFQIMSLSTD